MLLPFEHICFDMLQKSFEEIDDELEETLYLCHHVFTAVCQFLRDISDNRGVRTTKHDRE